MGARLRNIALSALAAALVLFLFGFAVNTPSQMPAYALVYLDETAHVYLAPQCVNAWRWRASGAPRALTRSNAGEARNLGFAADEACADTGAFTPPGPSLSRIVFEKAGLIGPQAQWWDAPYRTEHGVIYPPQTSV